MDRYLVCRPLVSEPFKPRIPDYDCVFDIQQPMPFSDFAMHAVFGSSLTHRRVANTGDLYSAVSRSLEAEIAAAIARAAEEPAYLLSHFDGDDIARVNRGDRCQELRH